MGERRSLFFVDNLRIALIVLVIAHHAGQAYGPTGGWWYFENPDRASILGAFFTVNRSFFMSLFFMISGYFLPASYDRKGAREFLGDRCRRLGWPLLVFFFAVIPVMTYTYYLNFRHYGPLPFLVYYSQVYFGRGARPFDWSGPTWPEMNFGHLWFVEHLLVFAVCYAIWRLIGRPLARIDSKEERPPRHLEILVFTFALAAGTFVVRIWHPIDKWGAFLGFIQVAFADVPRDLSFFVIGVIAYRRNWFFNMPKKTGKVWLLLGLAAAACCYVLRLTGHTYFSGGGLKVQSLVYDIWEAFLCSGLCIGLLVLFREKLNFQGPLAKNLAASTYAVYLFHVPVIVALQYAMWHTDMAAITKFAIVSAAAVPLTFFIGNYVRQLPFVRRIL
ncbi:MAG: acyltransferase [Thermodesulfobacteriota bacterium]|jgi:peptidoglycan/LPS O-acetylase OafA/YrhL